MVMLIWLFWGEIFLILTGGLFLSVFWTKLPPLLPWFYSLPWGERQLIPKWWHAVGLVALITISLLNLAITRRIKRRDEIAALVVACASILLVILYLASFFRVMLVMI